MCSGVVHASKTRCFGASNARVIRISVSLGSVTVAVPLFATVLIFALLVLEFVQDVVERRVALLPRPLVARDPVVDRLERMAVEPVQPPAAVVADVHEAD